MLFTTNFVMKLGDTNEEQNYALND